MQQTTARARRRSLAVLTAVAMTVVMGRPADPAGAATPDGTPLAGGQGTVSDGRIAFARNGKILTVLPDGSGLTSLTEGGSSGPSWSPDGAQIAYVQDSGLGARDLWIMAADGSAKTQVTTSGVTARGGADWSPDGSRLVFGGACVPLGIGPGMCPSDPSATVLNTISAIPPYGAPTTALADGTLGLVDGPMQVIDRVSWSPHGNHVLIYTPSVDHADDQYIVALHLDTGATRIQYSIGAHGVSGRLGWPAFSADGGRIAFDADFDIQADPGPRGITTCPYLNRPWTCGGEFREVRGDSQIAFAPSGSRVALVRLRPIRDLVVLADPDGTNRQRLVRGSQPSWQPVIV